MQQDSIVADSDRNQIRKLPNPSKGSVMAVSNRILIRKLPNPSGGSVIAVSNKNLIRKLPNRRQTPRWPLLESLIKNYPITAETP